MDGRNHSDVAIVGLLNEGTAFVGVDGEFEIDGVDARFDGLGEHLLALCIVSGVVPTLVLRAHREHDRKRDALLEILNGNIDIDAVHVSGGPFTFRWHDVLDLTVFILNSLGLGSLDVESIESDLDVIGACKVRSCGFVSHFLHGGVADKAALHAVEWVGAVP